MQAHRHRQRERERERERERRCRRQGGICKKIGATDRGYVVLQPRPPPSPHGAILQSHIPRLTGLYSNPTSLASPGYTPIPYPSPHRAILQSHIRRSRRRFCQHLLLEPYSDLQHDCSLNFNDDEATTAYYSLLSAFCPCSHVEAMRSIHLVDGGYADKIPTDTSQSIMPEWRQLQIC